jgi:hypothetical protein
LQFFGAIIKIKIPLRNIISNKTYIHGITLLCKFYKNNVIPCSVKFNQD